MVSALQGRLQRAIWVPMLALGALAASPAAQGGYKTEKKPEQGLTFPRPKNYEAIPVQPTEEFIVFRYAEEMPAERRDRKSVRPEFMLVRIDWVADPPPPEPEPEPDPEDEERTRSKPAEADKPKPPPLPISTLERYIERRMRGWTLGESTDQRARDGHECLEFEFSPKKGNQAGLVYTWKKGERTFVLIGICAKDDFKQQAKIWRTVAKKMRLAEPVGADNSKWARFYQRRSKFKAPEFRIKARNSLVGSWKADDTENYLFLFNTKNQKLIFSLKQEMEAIRKCYEDLFPAASPVEAVSVVRVCKDREEYFEYGGPPGSGGYWNSRAEELVFFEYEDNKKDRGSGKANSRIVLYHEAFHQYIHYSTGELPPHSWYNEGTGDFFSGAVFDRSGRVSKIGVNPWRIRTIQRAIDRGTFVPWKDIIKFEQPEYYRRDRVGLCYAQGWSMIYFLRMSKAAQREPDWAKILPTYFEILKSRYKEELALLEKIGQDKDVKQRQGAGLRAREAAMAEAFVGVDFRKIEAAWSEFILGLKVPK